MANIFDISDWEQGLFYTKNAIVKSNNKFYYSVVPHTSSSTIEEDIFYGRWSGIKSDENNQEYPFFFWKPSYNTNFSFNPRVNIIQFGDGYIQRSKKQINNNLLRINLNFEGIDMKEYAAINHFLSARDGEEGFLFVPPEPFDKLKKFICFNWTSNNVFYDNNTLSAEFIEIP